MQTFSIFFLWRYLCAESSSIQTEKLTSFSLVNPYRLPLSPRPKSYSWHFCGDYLDFVTNHIWLIFVSLLCCISRDFIFTSAPLSSIASWQFCCQSRLNAASNSLLHIDSSRKTLLSVICQFLIHTTTAQWGLYTPSSYSDEIMLLHRP